MFFEGRNKQPQLVSAFASVKRPNCLKMMVHDKTHHHVRLRHCYACLSDFCQICMFRSWRIFTGTEWSITNLFGRVESFENVRVPPGTTIV